MYTVDGIGRTFAKGIISGGGGGGGGGGDDNSGGFFDPCRVYFAPSPIPGRPTGPSPAQ